MLYKVLSNLKHNGKRYKKGDNVDLNDEAVETLLEGGVVVDPKAKKDDKDKDAETPKKKDKKKKDETKDSDGDDADKL